AAQALRAALAAQGAQRIALVAPYPVDLHEAGLGYWRNAGLEIVASLRVDPTLADTHRIYELTSDDALAALRRVESAGADCVVASGTGMPTLRALRRRRASDSLPVLSSNLCLAWALWRAVAPSEAPLTPLDLLDAIDHSIDR
ncbi:MAG: hypothetical protein ACKO9D_06300, partial [Gammaproteobacteria bacterium]